MTDVLRRPGGKVDVVGSVNWDDSAGRRRGGFVVRLRANGKRYRQFGGDGARLPDWSFDAAAVDRLGRTLGVSRDVGSRELTAVRYTAGGRLDPSFGFAGVADIERGSGGNGALEVSYSAGRPLIFNAGTYECRSSCPPKPVLIALQGQPRAHATDGR